MFKNKTPVQITALHTVESVFFSALLSLIVGLVQVVSTHGLDWPMLVTFASGGFLASMTQVYKSLSGNPTVMQAIFQTGEQVKAAIAQSPVVIHNNLPAQASVNPPMQQQPFPPARPMPQFTAPQQIAPPR